jgi:hypothetical protein
MNLSNKQNFPTVSVSSAKIFSEVLIYLKWVLVVAYGYSNQNSPGVAYF